MHVASEQRWSPVEITEDHIQEFRLLLGETSLKSKADKVVRNTVREWNRSVEKIKGWPSRYLIASKERNYILAWSTFPPSYRDEVEAFVGRAEIDWLEPSPGQPLRSRTKANYGDALRRAGSILVKLGTPLDSISSLREVVAPVRVRSVLEFIRDRTGRTTGGHVGYMAWVLLLAARHVHARESDLAMLEQFVGRTAETRRGMADRTWERLVQFDDPVALDRLRDLSEDLVRSVRDQPVSVGTAKTIRLALLVALCFDTGLRSGNVAALDLERHVIRGGMLDCVNLVIPGDEIKNGRGFTGPLTPSTARIWRLYLEKYRAIHMRKPCDWLFPRHDGSHWTQHEAYVDLKDACDKLFGLDVTPHLIRALVGKIVLDHYPGGHAIVQQVLGHKQLSTTVAYYAVTRQTTARAVYHELLEKGSNHNVARP